MITEKLNNFLLKQLQKLQKDHQFQIEKNDLNITVPPDPQFGDYTTPIVFKISKQINKSPFETAQLISNYLLANKPSFIKKIEAKEPGYLNFFIEEKFLFREFKNLLKNKKRFQKKQQPIIIEYSSPNIAKPMHIGHLRSTIIGETLARIYEFFNFRIIRWNYLGDWGTQFGKLIIAYKLWGNKKEIQKDPINNLLKLYQKFHQEVKNNPQLEEMARKEFKKLVLKDKTNIKIWQWFKKESLKDFQKIYRLLGIKFDIIKGEADFEKDVKKIIRILKQKNLLKESEGALIVPLEQFNLPPALIQKSDETSLYLTRDLASLFYRLKHYHPSKILYVVGNEQELYFKQLFSIINLIIPELKTKLIHIKFGLVLNTNKKKFSTREGELILLEDVLKEAQEKALKIIKTKHPEWSIKKQEKTALQLAIAALKFNDLKSNRATNLMFDWDKMYDYKNNSIIYLLYTYARFNKIIKKVSRKKINSRYLNYDYLNLPIEINLIKQTLNFKEILLKSLEDLSPNIFTSYLLVLTDLLNKYYETIPILKENNQKIRNARLALINQINKILKLGLNILGIETLNEI